MLSFIRNYAGLFFSERVGHATEIARNVCLNDYDGIAIVSGDGLVLEVIEGFLMRADRVRALKMPIAHIPGGTSNGLAAAVCFQCKFVILLIISLIPHMHILNVFWK